jgi:D-alanyl-D-alanine carboxypeptidase/D-alanyl-D-alanine-endopeptidase (penicillin-binding protein 4)
VSDAIAKVTSDSRYEHSEWGFTVRDLRTGEVLLDQNGGKLFTTGSILKVFSTATALHGYGPEYRFRAPVYRTGPVRGGVLHGDLVLVASGDLSMGLREQPDGSMFFNSAPEFDHTYANSGLYSVPVNGDPLAGVNALAKQVAEAGIHHVHGDVVIDDRLFNTYFGWPDATVSPVSPMVINDNRIDITSTPASVGRTATVDYRPKTAAFQVQTQVKTGAAGSGTDIEVTSPKPGLFLVTGQIAADAGPTLRVGEIPDPAAFGRTAFIEALNRAGVDVTASATGRNPVKRLPNEGTYKPDERVAEHVSGELSKVTKVILKTSQNPGANLMACLVAVKAGSKDCTAGLVAEATYAASLGVPPNELFIFDGAGGNELDHATGNAMTQFLRAVNNEPIDDAFRGSLAVLGVDGDLAQEEVGTPAAGRVAAKSGTRANVSPAGTGILTARTLVGYVNAKSGRQVLISVMVANVSFTSMTDLFAVVADNASVAVAMQEGY